MAFRNDMGPGGQQTSPGGGQFGMGGTGMGGPPMGGPGLGDALAGNQGVAGIEKTLKWRLLFFGGACAAFGSGFISVTILLVTFQWAKAPASFFSELCLLVFGFLMVVLDLPFPLPHMHLVTVRDHAYKFMLFLTRFTGRGVWYLWLGTMVWVALWDVERAAFPRFVAAICTTYLTILGILACVKGLTLSSKLNKVHDIILHSQRDASAFFARGQVKLSKEQFKMVIEQASNNPVMFTDLDIDYVLNALKFTPYGEDVTIEEIDYWLKPGWMLLV